MKRTTIVTVREFLEECGAAWEGMPTPQSFVLEHGMQFPTMAPKQPKLGRLKACYKNAAQLAMNSKDVIYVEGFAAGIIPVMHAWCIDLEGRVLEPTWTHALQAKRDYFGIPFNLQFLMRQLAVQEYYGLLDQPRHGWPVQSSPREEWIHPNYKEKGPQCPEDPASSTPSAKNS